LVRKRHRLRKELDQDSARKGLVYHFRLHSPFEPSFEQTWNRKI
jgi:hypothetical protein